MKKYYVSINGEREEFTRRRDAEKAAKKTGCSVSWVDVPAPGFVSTMRYYYRYFLSREGYDIYKAYARPSDRKTRSFFELQAVAVNRDVRVLGHNCMKYTAGMITEDKETGELFFRVDTADNVRIIPLHYVMG